MNCPKCGQFGMLGPFYEKNCYGERLNYRCSRCGYTTSTPTLDQRKANDYKQQPKEPKS